MHAFQPFREAFKQFKNTRGGAAPFVPTITLNPADKGSFGTLSNGNMTWTAATDGSWQGVRATAQGTGSKVYFEALVGNGAGTSNGPSIGVSNLTTVLSAAFGGSTANSIAMRRSGQVAYNGTFVATYATFTAGDVIGVAVDKTAGTIWFAKNNVWNGSPSAGTGGLSISGMAAFYPIAHVVNTAPSADAITARFAVASQTYAAPTGFVALDS